MLADCGNCATDFGTQTGSCLQPNECMWVKRNSGITGYEFINIG